VLSLVFLGWWTEGAQHASCQETLSQDASPTNPCVNKAKLLFVLLIIANGNQVPFDLRVHRHKSYHPYLEKNKERVRKDEERAAILQAEQEQQSLDSVSRSSGKAPVQQIEQI
jgi:hypothetical protein